MQVFQTAGVPPRSGRSIFATIGWTRKTSAAPENAAVAKTSGSDRPRRAPTTTPALAGAAGRTAGAGTALEGRDDIPAGGQLAHLHDRALRRIQAVLHHANHVLGRG